MTTQTTANFLGLPDILPDIYRASSSLDATKKHIETLEKEIALNGSNINAMLLKNQFEQYHYYIAKLSQKNCQAFNAIHQFNVDNHPTLNITTLAREKSFVSHYNKCRKLLSDGQPLSDIADIYACRTVIDDVSLESEELIKLCYTIMDETIAYMISLGYTPCGSSGVKDTEHFDPDLFPDVIVPKQSYLSEENKKYVKDYILTPKEDNGYQSLHVVFRDKSGRHFEYQVRTHLMNHQAEYGTAAHVLYKTKQQKKKAIPPLKIDRSKVHMSFYTYMYGELSDDAGLEKSSPCLQRTYHGA